MLEKTGVPSLVQIKNAFPDEERINKGPVAVIECFQNIPCNPCHTACIKNAIGEFKDINNTPNLDVAICNGCGLCISSCPGLSIMVVDGSYTLDEVLFKIPFEFLPLPKAGDIVKGVNRLGEYIGDVKIIRVQNSKANDKTPIVHVAVDRNLLYDFRNIRMEE